MSTALQIVLMAAAIAAVTAAAIVAAILPVLKQHLLAHPVARSSHRVPTPQGAGIGVVAATILASGLALALASAPTWGVGTPLIAAALLAIVGAVDDFRSIPIAVRLLLQAAAVALMLTAVPDGVLPWLPTWLAYALLFVAGLWFVNLVNFMDGIDWITVAEAVPVTAALAAFGIAGYLSPAPTFVAAALCGAYLGFAPFNRPAAKVFLGDVGSLPTGLLIVWCLFDLAAHGQRAAALLLPLYYLVDATLTLGRRLLHGERFWLAHRSHFYQRATDNGFSVLQVVSHIFALNIVLVALAALALMLSAPAMQLAAVVAGLVAVAFVLRRFANPA